MAASRFFSNTAVQTTLAGNISSGATALTVSATTGFPGTFPYTLAIDFGGAAEELVSVTSAASTTLTVTRAYGGTSAQSHSIGAVVRHVYDATEAAAFRVHEGATAAVHGLAGTVVGTSDTQTLGNKTLTAPTVNGGALSGTLTGSPTFTGAPFFAGGALFNRPAAANPAWRASVAADTNDRLLVQADGTMLWSSGAATADTTLFREGANQLSTTDTLLRVYRAATSNSALSVRVAGDTTSRFQVMADGTMVWGPGGATTGDVNLYRQAADILRTDDSLQVAGSLTVTGALTGASNVNTGAWVSYTPTWTASGTNPAIGLGTLTGKYALIGKTCHVLINMIASSTTTFGSGGWTFALPFPSVADGVFRVGNAHVLSNGIRTSGDVIVGSGVTTLSPYLSTSQTDTRLVQASATAPAAGWGNSDQLRMSITYEIA